MRQIGVEKYRKAAQTRVEAEGYAFVIQRPSCADVAEITNKRVSLDWAVRFVVGWEGVLESDLLPGGDPEPVAFDAALFCAWVKDRPTLWSPLIDGVIDAYQRYEEAAAARGKL